LRRKTDATGCQPSHLLDITRSLNAPFLWVSRYAERRIQQGRGRVDVAKNGSIKLVAGKRQSCAGAGNRQLASSAADQGHRPPFRRHGIFVEISKTSRSDVFIIQSTSFPAKRPSDGMLIITDALRRSSARRITRGDSVFRLCSPGPQGRFARADLGPSWWPI